MTYYVTFDTCFRRGAWLFLVSRYAPVTAIPTPCNTSDHCNVLTYPIPHSSEYTECQAFSPVVSSECTKCQAFCPVQLGSSHPFTRKRVLPPPLWFQGGFTLACGRGGGGPNSDEGKGALVPHVYNNPFIGVSVLPSPCLNHCIVAMAANIVFSTLLNLPIASHTLNCTAVSTPPPAPSQTTALQQY